MADLTGKTAFVTGGTSGIGTAIVKKFVEHGAQVVFTGRNVTAGKQIEKDLGSKTFFVKQDVSDAQAWPKAVQDGVEHFKSDFDILGSVLKLLK